MMTTDCFILVVLEGLLSLTLCVGLQYWSASVNISGSISQLGWDMLT